MAKNKNTIIWIIIAIVGILFIGPQLGLFATTANTGVQQQCISNEPIYLEEFIPLLNTLQIGNDCVLIHEVGSPTNSFDSIFCNSFDPVYKYKSITFFIQHKGVIVDKLSDLISESLIYSYNYKSYDILVLNISNQPYHDLSFKIGLISKDNNFFIGLHEQYPASISSDELIKKYIDAITTCSDVNEVWSPATSTQCSGVKFFQTSDLGNTREATGTKDCGNGNGDGKINYTWYIVGGIGLLFLLVILMKKK